jgi:hypothetical protein
MVEFVLSLQGLQGPSQSSLAARSTWTVCCEGTSNSCASIFC